MNLKLLLAGALTLVSGAAFAQSNPRVTPQAVIVNPVQTSLKVNVALDKSGSNPLYIEGEKQRITVSVNQDAYVYVFNIQANGVVAVLLPNGFSGGTPFLRAGEARTFPTPNAGYELTIGAPYGQEKILALASKTQLNLGQVIPQVGSNQIVNATVQGQAGLARALAVVVTPLPVQGWVTDVADFQTRSRVVAPSTGTLVVNVNSNGANVSLDGVLIGRGDTSRVVPAGQYTVRVTLNGFQDFQQVVNIGNGQTVNVQVNLQPIAREGTLVVRSNIAGARVFINGNEVGVINSNGSLTVQGLPIGSHELVLIAPNYRASVQTFSINGGQATTEGRVNPRPFFMARVHLPRTKFLPLELHVAHVLSGVLRRARVNAALYSRSETFLSLERAGCNL